MIKAIFFDIDGTLISFKAHKISANTLEALHKAKQKGVKLFIATGRHRLEINRFDGFDFDGYVTMNGQYCFNSKEVIHKRAIAREDVQSVVNLAEEDQEAYMFFEEDRVCLNKINKNVEGVLDSVKINNVSIGSLENPVEKEVYQIISFVSSGEENKIMEKLPSCDFTRWHPLFTDITPKGGSKKVGIQKMLEYHNLLPEEVMAIGDGENDISMLEFAGTSVAMGNASEEVKKYADYITLDVDNEGVNHALKHFGII